MTDPYATPPATPEPAYGPEPGDAFAGMGFLRVAVYFVPATLTMLSALWGGLHIRGVISTPVMVVLLILDVPAALCGAVVVHRAVSAGARGVGRALLATTDIAPPPSYPRQEVLIAQGRYAEAVDFFRDHIQVEPGDVDARLRLADLLERRLHDLAGAERVYLEVRRLPATPRQQMTAANGLIDVYRKTGNRGRLMVELARFAERYRGSPAADGAARELKELKATPPR